MDFKKFLEMMNEAESTAEKDDKAEKAAKKVAKDIEYDEGHKGKDDDKAEKAGEKVKKDIEYDDKKDKKKSLKDWFDHIDMNKLLAEAEQLTIEPAKQNTQVIKQGTKTIGTVTNPALAATIKSAIGKGEMSLAGKDMKEDAEDNPESAMLEKWAGDAKVKPTGQYKDKTKEELKSMLAKLHKSGPHDKDSPAAKKMRQINFALRAKGGWKSGEGAAMKEESLNEKAKNPYAIGMAQAMKSTGDKPPLKKSTITKAHDIAKSIKKKTDEAEIPNSGPDYGAGLGAGRKDNVLEYTIPKNKYYVVQVSIDSDEGRSIDVYDLMYNDKTVQRYRKLDSAQRQLRRLRAAGKPVEMNEESITETSKPDFLDLDKDGNKKESMKKAAADKKKKKVDEAMNTLEAAYHEGKSHGLTKHGYACRYDEGSDEHRRYHEGFKEGLDECYGLMPNRGLVVSEVDSVPATVPGMADQAMEAEIDEMNKTQYMQHKAKTTPGDTFKAFGQTFSDKEVLETDTFAFESLDKQLEALINEDVNVNEGLSVSMSTGQQGSPDSVSVTGTDDEAAKLLAFIKQVGLGGIGADAVATSSEPTVVSVSDYGAPKFSGHDDMVGLMKVASDDYKDEESHDHEHGEVCNECGMSENKCGCDEGKEMVDEVETPDQLEYEVAEDDGEGNIEADEQGAQIDAALAVGSENEKSVTEDGMESSPEAAGAVAAADAADEEEEAMSESEQLDEWANDAGKDGTQQAFTRDIEFMTKVISGGLNKPKSTGQTTIPVIAGQEAREGDEDVKAWKKLAGLAK